MGESHQKNQSDTLPEDINNKRELLLFDQVPDIDIFTPDSPAPEQRSFPDVCPKDIISGKQIFTNGACTFSANINDNYLNDEESMIPRGLLDIPCDKNDENEMNPNVNQQHYSIPCFIAFLPPGNANERYFTNFSQFNGIYGYPSPMQVPPPPIANYRPQINDLHSQYQRNVRTLNIPQSRVHQGLEYAWWNSLRQSPYMYGLNPNLDVKMFNSQRSLNQHNGYETYQQFSYGRYPFDFSQGDVNFNSNISCCNENMCGSQEFFQIPTNKAFHKNNCKTGKEPQTRTTNSRMFREAQEISNNINIKNMPSNEEGSLSQSNETTPSLHNDRNPCSFSQNDSFLSEDNLEVDTFQHTALYGCLQLEQILNSRKVVSDVDLKECCIKMRNELSKSEHITPFDLTLNEMIFAYLHICNSWISLNSTQYFKQDQPTKFLHFNLLIENFEAWESKSKVLLDSLIICIQSLIPQNQNKEPFSNYTAHSHLESNQTENIAKLDINAKECISNNNSAKNILQAKDINGKKNRNVAPYTENLSPETYRLEKPSESGFIYDTLIRELKRSQEKNSKPEDSNIFSGQELQTKKSTTSRKKCALTATRNNGCESKMEHVDNLLSDFKMSNYSLLNHVSNFGVNKDFNNSKLPEEEKHLIQRSHVDKSIHSEKLFIATNEGHMKIRTLENEKSKKYNGCVKNDSAQNEEIDNFGMKRSENNSLQNQARVSDVGNNRRYCLRQKRKNKNVNFLKNSSRPNDCGIIESGECVSGTTKMKMYDILLGIQSTDLKTMVSQKIMECDVSKVKQSLINPLMNIGHSLSRNFYKNVNEIIDDVYSVFYKAKRENKGNIATLTIVNRMELKLLNSMFEEIGTC